jgi:hypothetical protein
MNHYVTPQQLDSLNWIVGNVGGAIPSEVSNALAAMQVAKAAGDNAEYDKQFNIAVEANKKNGAAWGYVQSFHDQVENQEIKPNEPIPDPVEPGPPITLTPPLAPNHTYQPDWTAVDPNQVVSIQVTGDSFISSAEKSGGRPVWGTVGNAPAAIPFPNDPNITAWGTGATSKRLPIKPGQWYSTYFEPDGYGKSSGMRISSVEHIT